MLNLQIENDKRAMRQKQTKDYEKNSFIRQDSMVTMLEEDQEDWVQLKSKDKNDFNTFI